MPWVRKGKTIYKKTGGGLVKKQTCTSVANAKSALSVLHAVEHDPNFVPRGRKS